MDTVQQRLIHTAAARMARELLRNPAVVAIDFVELPRTQAEQQSCLTPRYRLLAVVKAKLAKDFGLYLSKSAGRTATTEVALNLLGIEPEWFAEHLRQSYRGDSGIELVLVRRDWLQRIDELAGLTRESSEEDTDGAPLAVFPQGEWQHTAKHHCRYDRAANRFAAVPALCPA